MKRMFEITCTVITPLFMGGASQQPELRTQSINGLLRWWFRAAGGSLEDEKRIFGWAGEKSNQGVVRIFIKEKEEFQPQQFSPAFGQGCQGYNYLGFSLNLTKRQAVPENTQFILKVSFHPKATDEDIKKFFCALWLAFNLGNFGSRPRRGFGSIKIQKIEKDSQDMTNNCYGLNFAPNKDLKEWIKDNLDKIKDVFNQTPRENIPHLFSNFEIYIFKSDNNWKNLLNEVGQVYQSFRRQTPIDKRIVFGLPIIAVGKYKGLRRASPLIFKVIKIGENEYTLLIIIMKPNTHNFIFHPNPNLKIEYDNWNLFTNFVKDIGKSVEKIYP